MNIFKKILGNIVPSLRNDDHDAPEESKYFPEKELPVDEEFTTKFKYNGGKFLYCENEEELKEMFISILQENDWFEHEAITYERNLEHYLIENKILFRNPINPVFILCSCESLIAQDGSVLFSSEQFLHHKAADLPKDVIVVATTSQITRSVSDGMRKIKYKYGSQIPSNISTLQIFKEHDEKDFTKYGMNVKNLYLLLLEDM